MSLWGAGVFEGDDQKDFAASLCEPLLKRIVAMLSRPDTLRRRTPETIDLLLCRMDALAALVGHISSENQGIFGGQLFPCDLPSPDDLAGWRRAFFDTWNAQAADWEADAEFQQARRARYEQAFDRLTALAAAQHRQREEARRAQGRRGRRS